MQKLLITIENKKQADQILRLLEDAEETERLDFPFNVERIDTNKQCADIDKALGRG